MVLYIMLYCIMLYCILLYSIVLYCNILYYIVIYYIMLYHVILCYIMLYYRGTARFSGFRYFSLPETGFSLVKSTLPIDFGFHLEAYFLVLPREAPRWS